MSLAVAEQPPKLEKKPVKFSNLLLGAGLNLFEVSREIPTIRGHGWRLIEAPGYDSGSAIGSHQDDHGCEPRRQLRWCADENLG